MNRSLIQTITSAVSLIALGVLLTDPFDLSMSDATIMLISGLLVVSLGIFAYSQWHERPADEREAALMHEASRVGYLAGMSVLVVALIIQSFAHDVDAWLVATIAVMVMSKLGYAGTRK